MTARTAGWPKAGQVKCADGATVEAKLATLTAAIAAAVASIPAARSTATVTRALTTAFKISTTRDALVVYTVKEVVTASIAGGQDGEVVLETADDSGFTTNVETQAIAGVGQTYTLAIALQGVQPQSGVLVAIIMANKWVRLRPVQTVGSPVASVRNGRETLL